MLHTPWAPQDGTAQVGDTHQRLSRPAHQRAHGLQPGQRPRRHRRIPRLGGSLEQLRPATWSLAGVGLSDRGDSIRFLFPDVTLKAGERTVVYCDDTNQAEPGKAYPRQVQALLRGRDRVSVRPQRLHHRSRSPPPILWPAIPPGRCCPTAPGPEVTYVSPGYENTEAGAEQLPGSHHRHRRSD